MSWQGRAACRDANVMMLFFGPDCETRPEQDVRERRAKAVCFACPLRTECLDYALGNPVGYGIWGGLNWKELSLERRRRARRVAA